MFDLHWSLLSHRSIIMVHGRDAALFLQGLITQDVLSLQPGQTAYGCLLTPQGKFLFDMFIHARSVNETPESSTVFYLDVEKERSEALLTLFARHRLRQDVVLQPQTDAVVFAIWNDQAETSHLNHIPSPSNLDIIVEKDPRWVDLGWRGFASSTSVLKDWSTYNNLIAKDFLAYQANRIRQGIPEGPLDLIPERTVILEQGLHELNALSWTKGCYMGQELMARTYHRGLIRKRMLNVRQDKTLPALPHHHRLLEPGLVLRQSGTTQAAGTIHSVTLENESSVFGLAMVRLEAVANALARTGQAHLELAASAEGESYGPVLVSSPPWMNREIFKNDLCGE